MHRTPMPTRYICIYTHKPISQQHPMQGLRGTAHMLLHMRWRIQPGLDPPVSAFLTLNTHSYLLKRRVWVCPLPSVWPLTPLPPHTVHSTSLDGGPEDAACESGDSTFTGNRSRQNKTNNKIKFQVSKKHKSLRIWKPYKASGRKTLETFRIYWIMLYTLFFMFLMTF